MKNFAVFLEGTNFWLARDGGRKHFGFFVTKRVEALSEEEAAQLAVQATRGDPNLSGQKDNPLSPTVVVKVVHELSASNKMSDTELVLFEME